MSDTIGTPFSPDTEPPVEYTEAPVEAPVETPTPAPAVETNGAAPVAPVEATPAPATPERRGRNAVAWFAGGAAAVAAVVGFAVTRGGGESSEGPITEGPAPASAEPFAEEEAPVGQDAATDEAEPAAPVGEEGAAPVAEAEQPTDDVTEPTDSVDATDEPTDVVTDGPSPRELYAEQFGQVETIAEGVDVGGYPIKPVNTANFEGLELLDATLHNLAWVYNTDQTSIQAVEYAFNMPIEEGSQVYNDWMATLQDGSTQRSELHQYVRTDLNPEGPTPNDVGGFAAIVDYNWYHVDEVVAAGEDPDFTGTFEYIPENGIENFGVIKNGMSIRAEFGEDNSLLAISFQNDPVPR